MADTVVHALIVAVCVLLAVAQHGDVTAASSSASSSSSRCPRSASSSAGADGSRWPSCAAPPRSRCPD
ncbi:hypothetical protein, partial [Bifidobacterium choerinum]|uniref:hypothetical protein n=1 Tax=Bifidobacterium choerinum TaxID=35760 RepID=UPI00054DFAD9